MKFGKHLFLNSLPEWAKYYVNYKALKKATMVQTRTKDSNLFESMLQNELGKIEDFYIAQEKELYSLLERLTGLARYIT